MPSIEPLSLEQQRSGTWKAVKQAIADRIEGLRKQNDQPLDMLETSHIRGKIEDGLELIKLLEPEELHVVEQSEDYNFEVPYS